MGGAHGTCAGVKFVLASLCTADASFETLRMRHACGSNRCLMEAASGFEPLPAWVCLTGQVLEAVVVTKAFDPREEQHAHVAALQAALAELQSLLSQQGVRAGEVACMACVEAC